MNMMASFNGLEGDLDAWRAIFQTADPRLGLRHMATPLGSALTLIELDLREAR